MRVPGIRFVQGRNRYGTSTKYAIAVHATANTAAAADEAAYATRRTDGTSSHFYADNVEVVQSLDTADVAGHAGSTQGNTYAIAVEFTGLTSWSRAKWLSSVAWDRIGAVLAAVSRAHNIPATRASVSAMRSNPRVRGAYDHNQMRLAWGGTDHTDPGPNFPWDRLLAVWQQHLGAPTPQQEDDMPSDFTNETVKLWDGALTTSYQSDRCLATGSPTLPGSAAQGGGQSHWLVGQVRTLVPQVAVLTRTVEQLAAALQAGGSDLDTAAVLTRIDQRAAEDATRDAEQAARVAELELQLEEYRAAEAKAAQAQADALATRQS